MPRNKTRKLKTEEIQNRVFISYSRRDTEFVKRLYAELAESKVNAWVDWEDIPPSAQWMSEIRRGIDAADAFAFVLSSNSLASDVCRNELEHAVVSAKRLIPLVIEEPKSSDVPEALKSRNWIFSRKEDEFAGAVTKFIEAVSTDLDKLRMHARLLIRAREWAERERDSSFLLRGLDLRQAESWLAAIDARGPVPSALHADYVLASQKLEREEAERWKQLYQQSLARQLAAQSQLLIDQRGTALPLAAALAVEAAQRSPSLETDQALRKALRLMPQRISKTPLPDTSTRVVAEKADCLALVHGSTIEIWPLADGKPTCIIQAGGPLSEVGISMNPLAVSRDGSRVAGIAGRHRVCVWQTADGSLVREHQTDAEALGVAFSADAGKLAITTDANKTVLLDLNSGEVQATLQHDSQMPHVSLHPAATEIAVWGNQAGEIWDLSKAARITTIQLGLVGGHRAEVRYSNTGEYLALISKASYEINLFHVPTRRLIFTEKRHVDLAFEPQDRGFAIASPEWDIGVYSLPKAERLFHMRHDNSVWRIAFSPDGTRLVSKSQDQTVRVWEVEREGREVGRIVESGWDLRDVVFSQDSKRIHLIRETELESRDRQGLTDWLQINCGSQVFKLDASTTGSTVLYGCRDGSWVLMDYGDLRKWAESRGRNAMGEQIRRALIAGCTSSILIQRALGGVTLIDLERQETDAEFNALAASEAVSDGDGNVFLLADEGRDLICWSATSRKILARRRVDDGITALAVARCGAPVAGITKQGVVALFDAALSNETSSFDAKSATAIALSPDGKRAALIRSAESESNVCVVEIPGNSDRKTWEWIVPSMLHELRFDSSGTHVVMALRDKSVQVWNIETRSPVAIHRHESEASTACFLAEDGFVASGGWDGVLRIWPWKQSHLIGAIVSRMDRDMTAAEWNQYLPGEPYRTTRNAGQSG
jgi:WD40 repeat protein